MDLIQGQKKPQQSFYLESIDFLRGYAALAVMIHHVSEGVSFSSRNPVIQFINHIFSYGALGVPLFFVVSGFCIHRRKTEQFLDGLDEPVSFRNYWIRRFHRLYPSYFVVCVLSAGLLLIGKLAGVSSMTIQTYPGNPYLFLLFDLFTHLLMIHCFFSWFDFGLGNGPLWTLAREEQYYLLYFPLLQIRKRWTVWTCLALSVIASNLVIEWGNSIKSEHFNQARLLMSSSLAYWPQWVLGMLSVEIVSGLHPLFKGPFKYRLTILMSLILTILQVEFGSMNSFLRNLVLGLAAFIFITTIATLETEGRWTRNAFFRLGSTFGHYSYSLYLVHYPIVIILSKIARQLGSSESVPVFVLATLATGVLCQIPAIMLYRWVERYGQTRKQ